MYLEVAGMKTAARHRGFPVLFWVQLPLLVLVPIGLALASIAGSSFRLSVQDHVILVSLSAVALAASAHLHLRVVRRSRERNILSILLVVCLYAAQLALVVRHRPPDVAPARLAELAVDGSRPKPPPMRVNAEEAKPKVAMEVASPAKAPTLPPATALPADEPEPKRVHLAPFGGTLLTTKTPQTISVILPCAEERETSIRTVERFCERTPFENLAEIIVVDDGSQPPLQSLFARDKRRLDQNPRCRLKFVRHAMTTGLMAAKLTGGKVAQGDILAFIDCHCAPQWKWEEPILRLVRENPRRMVVPEITDLDMDTFDEKKPSAVYSKCYLTFDGDFKWFDDDSDYIPTISGGLVAMGREWFNLTGGFDEAMHGWGGENLDQSLRAWLCGGEIMRARGSRIAHMWRGGDPRTTARYRVKAAGTNNRGRVAAAWYDKFLDVYRGRVVDKQEVRNYDGLKQRLQCRPFSYFVYRFRRIYIEGGVIPKTAFQIREKRSNLCLTRHIGTLVADECGEGRRQQIFQFGNVNTKTRKCCKGLRIYSSNDCIDYIDDNGPHFYPCDVSGNNGNQGYILTEGGHIRKDPPHEVGNECLYVGTSIGKRVQKMACKELEGDQGIFERIFEFETKEWGIWKSEMQKYRYDEDFPDLLDN